MWHHKGMDDDCLVGATNAQNNLVAVKPAHWLATLTLDFDEKNGRSYLAKRQHNGPLVIQKTLYPEGDALCHGIIIHPPGGVAGGDELILNVNLQTNASALLTTPGAGKWYKANGTAASQHLQFDLAEKCSLEWLPQENILFDGSIVNFSADINLGMDAKYAGWEILCFGRRAKGESWLTGKLNQKLVIKRADKTIWQESAHLEANDRFFHSAIGLGGNVVSASFVIAAGAVPTELFTQCQQFQIDNASDSNAKFGVSALPEVFSARYIGMSAQSARYYFEGLWHILRPWYASRSAARPRIWNT
ncbi:MAG: urease accessory protein UreD [Pseudomonadota bacterium]